MEITTTKMVPETVTRNIMLPDIDAKDLEQICGAVSCALTKCSECAFDSIEAYNLLRDEVNKY